MRESKIYTIIIKGKNVSDIDKAVESLKKKFKGKAVLDIVRHVIKT